MICNHLGHTLDVHQRWYRLPDSTMEIVKMGRILMNEDVSDSDKEADLPKNHER